jgi:hypothetical protein
MPVAAQSKAWVGGRSLPRIVGSNPAGGRGRFVSCECCVLRGRGVCVGLTTRTDEFYRL